MPYLRQWLPVLTALTACSAPAIHDPERVLSDSDLLQIQSERFDAGQFMGRTLTLGRHKGLTVIAEHPCGDLCPRNTIRIVRYYVQNDSCESIGGKLAMRMVPSFVPRPKMFCVPSVLARA